MTDLEMAINLLKVAICPNCDGSGGIPRQTSSRSYVSREMAMDCGMPDLEGSLYTDDEWELEQCQWCDEKNTLIIKINEAGYSDIPNRIKDNITVKDIQNAVPHHCKCSADQNKAAGIE